MHSVGFDQQVHVVAHKDTGINLEVITLTILVQLLKVIFAIRITAKDHLPLIAAAYQMQRLMDNSLSVFAP